MNCVEDVDLCCPYPTKLDGALECRSSALAAAGLQQQHQGCCTLHSVVPLPMLNNVVHPCMQDSVVPLPMLDSVVHFCMLDSVVHREHLCCTHRELCGQWGQ